MPIMVLSEYCLLSEKSEKELQDLGECLYDQGGYFIINGGEKVSHSLHGHIDQAALLL